MPDFHITYRRPDGTQGTCVLSAPDKDAAAGRIVRKEYTVVRIKEIVVSVGKEPAKPLRGRRSSAEREEHFQWRDFWSFKYLITPLILRWLFVAFTVASVGSIIGVPVVNYALAKSEVERSLRSTKQQLAEVRVYIREADAFEKKLAVARADAERYRDQPESTIIYGKASREVDQIVSDLRNRGKRAGGVENSEEARDREAVLKDQIKETRREGASLWRMAGEMLVLMLTVPFIWLYVRVMLEFLGVIFSIHDRLVEISGA